MSEFDLKYKMMQGTTGYDVSTGIVFCCFPFFISFSRDVSLPKNKQQIEELLNSTQSRRPKLETIFNELAMARDYTGKDWPSNAAVAAASASGSGSKSNDQNIKASENSSSSNNKKGKGKNKNKNKNGKGSRKK